MESGSSSIEKLARLYSPERTGVAFDLAPPYFKPRTHPNIIGYSFPSFRGLYLHSSGDVRFNAPQNTWDQNWIYPWILKLIE